MELKPNTKDGYKCEWCGMKYPLRGWDYYQIIVFKKLHTICSDCFDHLIVIEAKDQGVK